MRPLTLQKGMIRANAIFTDWDDGVDNITGITLGASIGVTDDLELGINNYRVGSSLQQNYEGLVAVTFTPSAGYGDIPVYGRYRLLHREKLDFAGDVIFIIPVNSTFAFQGDLPFRIKPNDRLSVDTGMEVRGTFGDAKYADIRIPAIVNFNFSDHAFIAGETGVWFVNLGKSYGTAGADTKGIAIPVGFRAGGTWKKSDKQIVDLFAGFAFPALIEAGTSRSTFDGGIWDIFVGVAFNTRPLSSVWTTIRMIPPLARSARMQARSPASVGVNRSGFTGGSGAAPGRLDWLSQNEPDHTPVIVPLPKRGFGSHAPFNPTLASYSSSEALSELDVRYERPNCKKPVATKTEPGM